MLPKLGIGRRACPVYIIIMRILVLEREYRDYLYENPHLLFPNTAIDRKSKEVCIEGRYVDLLFEIADTQYIVELKRDTVRSVVIP